MREAIVHKKAGIVLIALAWLCSIWTPTPVLGQVVTPGATPLRFYSNLLHGPARIAIDSASRLYVSDSVAGRVLVRDAYGRFKSVSPHLERPLGIAVDATGLIYVGEEAKGSITVFDQNWTPLRRLGAGDGEFMLPNHIAIDPSGSVYVADSAANVVKKYSPSGQLLLSIGGPGTLDGQFNFPTGLYVAPDGTLIVADQNNNRLQVFGSNGTFLWKVQLTSGMLGTGGGRIQGVTIDGLGRWYVADTFMDYVRIFKKDGSKLTTIGMFGSGLGQLLNPSSVAMDQYNRLFVASVGNARVDVYGIDSFSDPHVLAADFSLQADTLTRVVSPTDSKYVSGLVRVPGYDPKQIVRNSLRINGLAVKSGGGIGDFDGDGLLELRFLIDRAALLNTLPDGEAIVIISGFLNNGMEFGGETTVRVEPGGSARARPRPGGGANMAYLEQSLAGFGGAR